MLEIVDAEGHYLIESGSLPLGFCGVVNILLGALLEMFMPLNNCGVVGRVILCLCPVKNSNSI